MAASKSSKRRIALRIAPFQMLVVRRRNGFRVKFRGTTPGTTTPACEVELEFPSWWAAELQRKLAPIVQ